MHDGPWATALDRLIRERKGLTKARIAALAKDEEGKAMRPGQISKIAAGNSDKFRMSFLVRIAEAITKFDREKNIHAPDVPLWEFFVTDEQAEALRDRASKTRGESVQEMLMKEFGEFLQHKTAPAATPPAPTIVAAPPRKTRAK